MKAVQRVGEAPKWDINRSLKAEVHPFSAFGPVQDSQR
jgi:hypothetical protein